MKPADGARLPTPAKICQLVPPEIVHPLVAKLPLDQFSVKMGTWYNGGDQVHSSEVSCTHRFLGADLICARVTLKVMSPMIEMLV